MTAEEELELLRLSAANIIMNPSDRAFFNLQRLIDRYPQTSDFYVLAMAIFELRRELKK